MLIITFSFNYSGDVDTYPYMTATLTRDETTGDTYLDVFTTEAYKDYGMYETQDYLKNIFPVQCADFSSRFFV